MGAAILEQQEQLAYKESFPTTMNENIIVPPPPPSTLSSQIETGAGGVQTQITGKKTLIRVFIVGFLQLYYIFYGSKGSKHLSGVGGCNFLILLFFFEGGGGGVGGVQILISIETYITCDFSGG